MPIKIIVSTNSKDYVFEPCLTDTPVPLAMSANEVKEVHSKSKVFVDGWLSFEDEEKADVYKYLRIQNGENILNQIEIMNCIVSGTKDDVEKLISIKSKGYFERVYGVYTALKQSNMYDISMRVAKAIEYRYTELQKGIINTQIKLSETFKSDNRDKVIAEQEALLKENQKIIDGNNKVVEDLQKQIEELTKKIANIQNVGAKNTTTNNTQNTNEVTPNKRGRKPSTTKE
jgi:hypothetical protein